MASVGSSIDFIISNSGGVFQELHLATELAALLPLKTAALSHCIIYMLLQVLICVANVLVLNCWVLHFIQQHKPCPSEVSIA